jgi:hypothetical protein
MTHQGDVIDVTFEIRLPPDLAICRWEERLILTEAIALMNEP